MDWIAKDSVDQAIPFHLETGGLNVSDFKIGFIRYTRGDPTSIVETGPTALTALASIVTAHTDNYGIYLDTDATGGSYFHFRADFPDAAFAAGADEVICHLYHQTDDVIASRIFRLDTLKKNSSSMTFMLSLSAGDKIKIVGTLLQGFSATTIADSVRLKIKKVFTQ